MDCRRMFNDWLWHPKPCDHEDSLHCCHKSQSELVLFLLYALFYYYINYLYYYTHCFKTRNSDLGAYSLQKIGQHAHPQLGISEQTKPQAARTHASIIKGSWSMACPPSAGPSGYALRMYAIQPARIAGLNSSPNASTVWAMPTRLSRQIWSAIPSSTRTWK